jgi:DNA-binding transcriptional regulator LsrR (DeoR family)
MYHEQGIRQPQIAAQLGLSQPRVSRLLRQAVDLRIVRTVVQMPEGVHADLEEDLQRRFGLRDAVVVDTTGAGEDILPALGAATASYLDVTLTGGNVVGVASWSETLLGGVQRMPVKKVAGARRVVQLLGGVGRPAVQVEATRLTQELASRTGAEPLYLSAPGLVDTPAVRRAVMRDRSVSEVVEGWGELTDAIVGIGSIEPSPLLARSGNAISAEDQEELRRLGAVGDVCFRFFDAEGKHVRSALDQRVIGIAPEQLLGVPRRVGVAGGRRKYAAVRAAVLGGWVNVLITDLETATRLAEDDPAS